MIRRRVWLPIGLAAGLAGLWWGAASTETGYFWLHRAKLRATIADIMATPAITSLDLGQDERTRDGVAYDSYRFINSTVVTHYSAQAAPGASQPVLYVEDLLRQLGVDAAAYRRLREDLAALSMAGFSREPGGQVSLLRPEPGGTPWGEGLVYSPSDKPPRGPGVQGYRRLAPHWFQVDWG